MFGITEGQMIFIEFVALASMLTSWIWIGWLPLEGFFNRWSLKDSSEQKHLLSIQDELEYFGKANASYWIDKGIVKPTPFIVCVANKVTYEDKEYLLIGIRHFDFLMRYQLNNMGLGRSKAKSVIRLKEGFIDQFGDFYTREEAMFLVKRTGQPINLNGTHDDEKLFSECLYHIEK